MDGEFLTRRNDFAFPVPLGGEPRSRAVALFPGKNGLKNLLSRWTEAERHHLTGGLESQGHDGPVVVYRQAAEFCLRHDDVGARRLKVFAERRDMGLPLG